jgi:hypothetical protein
MKNASPIDYNIIKTYNFFFKKNTVTCVIDSLLECMVKNLKSQEKYSLKCVKIIIKNIIKIGLLIMVSPQNV